MSWWKSVYHPPVRKSTNDHVTYATLDPVTQTWAYLKNQTCFAAAMRFLGTRAWRIEPVESVSAPMKPDRYLQWVDICKQNGVMPLDAEPSIEDGKIMLTLSGGIHEVYAGLCCFRWAANNGVHPTLVLDLLDARPCIDFFQALTYSLFLQNTLPGHSFTGSILVSNGVYKSGSAIDLRLSLGMKSFFAAIRSGSKSQGVWKLGISTSGYIAAHTKSLIRSPLILDNVTDLLWDEWAPLHAEVTNQAAMRMPELQKLVENISRDHRRADLA